MRKFIYALFIVLSFLLLIPNVNADFGDLNYEITDVSINDNNITITGYAFIHRTHNYVTVYERTSTGKENSKIVKNDGKQTIKIKIQDNNGNVLEKESIPANTPNGYNFYYQMFFKNNAVDYGIYSVDTYNNTNLNLCNDNIASQCYYEDLGFSISFTIDELFNKFGASSELSFYIAASNTDYTKKVSGNSNNLVFTAYENMKIPPISYNSDYIEVLGGASRGNVRFIAQSAILRKVTNNFGDTSGYYGNYFDNSNAYYILDYDDGGFKNGYKVSNNNGIGGQNFLDNTKAPGLYTLCIDTASPYTIGADSYAKDGCSSVSSNNYCTSCSGTNKKIVYSQSSWLSFDGFNTLKIRIKNINKCDPITPSSGELNCNDSKTFNSACDELTVITDKGATDVKIEQKGYISSVLTPNTTYAGSGFNFGIMYYNTIKWSYAEGQPSSELHTAVTNIMNSKIKEYNSYIARLNINELKFGDKIIDTGFLVKKCTTSDTSNNYYNKELNVSCIFYIPKSNLEENGNVTYYPGEEGNGISNKYYTPLDYVGNYKIEAKIVGMDRITASSAVADMNERNVPSGWGNYGWTGNWSDTFKNCIINLYPLLYNETGKYNFIYRPIDIYNPFPNRNAGINWYDWYNIEKNKNRLESTYSNLQYTAIFNNQTIKGIKEYNKDHNYLNWDSIDENGRSSFIDDYDYIKREGGNS